MIGCRGEGRSCIAQSVSILSPILAHGSTKTNAGREEFFFFEVGQDRHRRFSTVFMVDDDTIESASDEKGGASAQVIEHGRRDRAESAIRFQGYDMGSRMRRRVGRGQGGARQELREVVNPKGLFVHDKDLFVRQHFHLWYGLKAGLELAVYAYHPTTRTLYGICNRNTALK